MGKMTHSLIMLGFLVSVVDLSHRAGKMGNGNNDGLLWGEYIESWCQNRRERMCRSFPPPGVEIGGHESGGVLPPGVEA
jgi:hypothetical protein